MAAAKPTVTSSQIIDAIRAQSDSIIGGSKVTLTMLLDEIKANTTAVNELTVRITALESSQVKKPGARKRAGAIAANAMLWFQEMMVENPEATFAKFWPTTPDLLATVRGKVTATDPAKAKKAVATLLWKEHVRVDKALNDTIKAAYDVEKNKEKSASAEAATTEEE